MALVTLLVGLMTGSIAHGQIYKWTDEKGNVHFGDKPEDAGTASEAEAVDLELNYKPPERTPEEIEALKAEQRAKAMAGQRRMEAAEREEAEELAARNEQKMEQCRALDAAIDRFGSSKRVNGRLRTTFMIGEDGQSISEEEQRLKVEELKRRRESLGCP